MCIKGYMNIFKFEINFLTTHPPVSKPNTSKVYLPRLSVHPCDTFFATGYRAVPKKTPIEIMNKLINKLKNYEWGVIVSIILIS